MRANHAESSRAVVSGGSAGRSSHVPSGKFVRSLTFGEGACSYGVSMSMIGTWTLPSPFHLAHVRRGQVLDCFVQNIHLRVERFDSSKQLANQ